jgi:hypothetical protein
LLPDARVLIETIARFGIGGLTVALFAVIGMLCEPKTFAGIFGAAPAVALATLAITYVKHGAPYAALEGRSMALGAVGMALYALCARALITRPHFHSWWAATLPWPLWFATAALAWIILRS